MNSKLKTKRIALSGVLSALAVLLMALGSVITALDMSAAYAAGFAVIIARIEMDRACAIGVYASSSLLAFVLLPNKYAAVVFAVYGGAYPILKEFCEKIKNKTVMWVCKFVASNILLTLMIWLSLYFTVASDEPLGFEWWIYLLGNFVFFVYDYALTMVISKYYVLFRRRR